MLCLFQENSRKRERAYQKGKTKSKRLADALETLLAVADFFEAGINGVKLGVDLLVEAGINSVDFLVEFFRLLLHDFADKFLGRQRIQLAAQFADFAFVASNLFRIGQIGIPKGCDVSTTTVYTNAIALTNDDFGGGVSPQSRQANNDRLQTRGKHAYQAGNSFHIVGEVFERFIKIVGHPYLPAGAAGFARLLRRNGSRHELHSPAFFRSDKDSLAFARFRQQFIQAVLRFLNCVGFHTRNPYTALTIAV